MSTTQDREVLVRSLVVAGWLSYTAWLMFLFRQVARTVSVGGQPFAGVWDQRIEVMSFTVLPPNALILVPAAIAAIVAIWLTEQNQTLDLAVQIRIVRWSAVLQVVIAVVSVLSIIINDTGSPTEAQDLAMRFSGLLISASIIVLTRTVERLRPGHTDQPSAPESF